MQREMTVSFLDSILFSPLTVDAIRHGNQDMIIPAWQHMVGMLKLDQAPKQKWLAAPLSILQLLWFSTCRVERGLYQRRILLISVDGTISFSDRRRKL